MILELKESTCQFSCSPSWLRDLVKKFKESIFICDNSVLFCKVYDVKVVVATKYNIQLK